MSQLFAFLMPFAALPLAVSGCSVSMPTCARGLGSVATMQKSPHAPTHARDRHPINIDYKITRSDASDAVILAGETDLDLGRSATIERHADHDSAKLRLTAERGDDDRWLVSIDWDEQSREGHGLRWSPTLAMGFDGTATAKLDLGGGDGRKVTVTIHPSSLPQTGVSHGSIVSSTR